MHLLYCVFPKQSDGLGSSTGFSPFPFLWAEPCHTGVSLFRYAGHGRTTIPQVALGSLHESLAFLGHGVQFPLARCISNVSDCFIQLSKNTGKKKITYSVISTYGTDKMAIINHFFFPTNTRHKSVICCHFQKNIEISFHPLATHAKRNCCRK